MKIKTLGLAIFGFVGAIEAEQDWVYGASIANRVSGRDQSCPGEKTRSMNTNGRSYGLTHVIFDAF